MLLPNNFEDIIAKNFYDKKINKLNQAITTNDEGEIIGESTDIAGEFYGNLNFSNYRIVKDIYGIDKEIDVVITTNKATDIAINDVISYSDVIYKVSDVIVCDSHKKIVGNIWRNQQT